MQVTLWWVQIIYDVHVHNPSNSLSHGTCDVILLTGNLWRHSINRAPCDFIVLTYFPQSTCLSCDDYCGYAAASFSADATLYKLNCYGPVVPYVQLKEVDSSFHTVSGVIKRNMQILLILQNRRKLLKHRAVRVRHRAILCRCRGISYKFKLRKRA